MSQPMRNLSLLSRIFRRSDNATLAKVHAHAIGQPLLVHPALGEQLVGAFVHGAVDTPPTIRMAADDASAQAGDAPAAVDPEKVAILNITGGLVNRPMPDVCGPGPISYVAIRAAFDQALADSNVEAIIFRMNSPGGMASGCFDLTDHIYANRLSSGGPKRVIAPIDDMAYSGGYAIAAACDEIWISRTGGVGSVGVVAYHCDQSAADAKAGLKVTPIYSGARKIDFNPHFPLSPEAQQSAQAESDDLYGIFIGAVAMYRGIDSDAVRGTQAATFMGAAAVTAGFADRQGTLYDVLADLANPAPVSAPAPATEPEPTPEPVPPVDAPAGDSSAEQDDVEPVPGDPEGNPDNLPAPPQEDAKARETAVTLRRGSLALALTKSTLPGSLVAAVIAAVSDTDERPTEQIMADASRILDLCVAAGVKDLAADIVKEGLSVEQARKSIAAAKADVGPELVTTLPEMSSAKPTQQAGNVLDGVSIYQQRGKRHVSQ